MHGERSTGRIRVDEQKQTETKQNGEEQRRRG